MNTGKIQLFNDTLVPVSRFEFTDELSLKKLVSEQSV